MTSPGIKPQSVFLFTWLMLLNMFQFTYAAPTVEFGPSQLSVVINELDPLSIKIGEYYADQRQIPNKNIIRIKFNPGNDNMSADTFKLLRWRVVSKTPEHVQAYALTWAAPFKVEGCMSITSAFAFGFDKAYCGGCNKTKESPYFNSTSRQPYSDFNLRPTMSIAAINYENAKKLIDSSIASDYTMPKGTAYLMNTPDSARNIRPVLYPEVVKAFKPHFNTIQEEGYELHNKSDIFFYFTGQATVPNIASLNILPGGVADHLTSVGGELVNETGQMSVLRWLEAGAAGSYGTVTEPCGHIQKFPHPGVVMFHYLKGETLIEAYWKSVAWPGQGIFVGEPLAKPFARH